MTSTLVFIAYIDPNHKVVRPVLADVPLVPYDDMLETEEEEKIRIANTPTKLEPLPQSVVITDKNGPRTRNRKYLRSLLAKRFPQAANRTIWPDTRCTPKKIGFQVSGIKCFVEQDQALVFLNAFEAPSWAQEGARLHLPPSTRRSLLALGVSSTVLVYPRAEVIVPKKSRQRRNHALYIYTTARKRGQNTKAGLNMDAACSKLYRARLHLPRQGRVTAYCYEIPLNNPLDNIAKFVQGALTLRATDPLVHITARAPLAISRLNQYIASLDASSAVRVQAILGPLKSLEPGVKWTERGPASREDKAVQSGFVFEPANCTEQSVTVADPSPRQDNPNKRKPLEAVSFVVFPNDGSSGLVPTVRLKQLLDVLPNGPSFVPTTHEGSPAAALKVNLDDEGAIADFLAKTKCLQSYGFRFVVRPFEAETWFSKFLDENCYPEDVATLVTPCWTRTLPGTGVNH